jgi:hypothetical protein
VECSPASKGTVRKPCLKKTLDLGGHPARSCMEVGDGPENRSRIWLL